MDKKEKVGIAKVIQKKRDEFLNNIVFFFVSCGTPNNPPDREELRIYRNFIPDLVGFGVEEYREKMKELLGKDEKDKISDLERNLDQLYDEYIEKGDDDVSVPGGMAVPGDVSVTLVVREGEEYRVMKLS